MPGYGPLNKTAHELRLESFKSLPVNSIYLTSSYLPLDDTSGQNMVTHCTWLTSLWIEKQFQVEQNSTGAAIASEQFAGAHEKHGQNKPTASG